MTGLETGGMDDPCAPVRGGARRGLRLRPASPEEILCWSSGEVTRPDTLDAPTLRPVPGGLGCERTFGATAARGRRARRGHIAPAAPVAHPSLARGATSPPALLPDLPPGALVGVLAYEAHLVTGVDEGRRSAARARHALERGYAASLPALDRARPGQLLDEAGVRALASDVQRLHPLLIGAGAALAALAEQGCPGAVTACHPRPPALPTPNAGTEAARGAMRPSRGRNRTSAETGP